MRRRTLILGGGGLAIAAAAGAGSWRYATGSVADYDAYQAALRAPMGAELREVIRYSTLAANSHNTQPWRYRIDGNAIDILPDVARRTPVVDPDDHHLYVSLGCAAENLALAAAAAGLPGEFVDGAADSGIRFAFRPGEKQASPLFGAIPVRQSSRGLYDGRALAPADMTALEAAARAEGVTAVFITDKARRTQLGDLVIAANIRQMADPAFIRELKDWLRFNPRTAMRSGDGLFSAASGNPVMPDLVAGLAFDLAFTAASEDEKYRRQMESSAGFVVFFGDGESAADWIRVGRACQRFMLAATAAGVKTAFLNQPVEVAEFRAELAALSGQTGRRPDLVLRFGYGPALPYSPRRPVDAVLG